jgi:hypothetical protein
MLCKVLRTHNDVLVITEEPCGNYGPQLLADVGRLQEAVSTFPSNISNHSTYLGNIPLVTSLIVYDHLQMKLAFFVFGNKANLHN